MPTSSFVGIEGGRKSSPRHRLPGKHANLPVVLSHSLERNFEITLVDEAGKLLAPFDQQEIILPRKIIESQRLELASSIHPVQIDMIDVDRGPAIFMNQSEGGAGYVLFRCRPEPLGNSLCQGGLTGAERTPQYHELRGRQQSDQFPPQSHCFFGGMGHEFPLQNHDLSITTADRYEIGAEANPGGYLVLEPGFDSAVPDERLLRLRDSHSVGKPTLQPKIGSRQGFQLGNLAKDFLPTVDSRLLTMFPAVSTILAAVVLRLGSPF